MSFYNQLKSITEKSTSPKKKTPTKIATYSSQEEYDIDDITVDELPLEVVKQYLRIDHDFDDLELKIATKSAISYVRGYIKAGEDEALDFEMIMPVLTLISHFYESKTPIGKANEKVDILINSILHMNRRDIVY